jgi:hypothetical protein
MSAASTLIQTEGFEQVGATSNGGLTELKNTIGWGPRERPDVIDKEIDSAVEAMESICRPILSDSTSSFAR